MSKEPINVDLGASVKLEVKTEVPAEASGRLVHAAADALSPITELLGMVGDTVRTARIYRRIVAENVIYKAQEKIAASRKTPLPAPAKVVIPLLEHASQEDPEDHSMIDMWANLLASSMTEGDAISPRFISLLSEINGRQAALLKDIYQAYFEPHNFGPYLVARFGDTLQHCAGRTKGNLPDQTATEALVAVLGPGLLEIGAMTASPLHGFNPDHCVVFAPTNMRSVDLEILISLGLLADEDFGTIYQDALVTYSFTLADVTDLGAELIRLVGAAVGARPRRS